MFGYQHEVVGSRVKVKIVKNKIAPPFKITEFDIMYGKGISYEADVLNTAVKYDVVKRSGSSYTFEDERIGVGLEKSCERLREDKKLLNTIKKKILEALKKSSK